MKIRINQKKFDELVIFTNVDISLESGIYILKGRNGIGKSTLFNIIYREDEDFSGEVTYNGKDISLYDKEFYRNNICTLFTQTNNFFDNLTIKEILEMFYGINNVNEIEVLLKKLNLKDKKNRKYCKISGGEKQKVRLIIALLSSSKILLLDEPENNLDSKSIEVILEYLKKNNKIIIISSHMFEENISGFNYLKIIDENIKLEKYSGNSTDNQTIDREMENTTNITKSINNKIISKLNNKLKTTIVAISIIILLFSTVLILSFDELEFTTRQLGNSNMQVFKNNSTVIYPPMSNQYFFNFGTNGWVEKHASYFNEDDYSKLKEIDYVTKVEPINLYTSTIGKIYTDDNYILGPEIDCSKLDYKKYDMQEYQSDSISKTVEYGELLSKKSIAENVPIDYHGNIDKLIYGEFPEDNTEQVMIDIYLAIYIAQEQDLKVLEDLINEKIRLPAMKVTDYGLEYSDYGGEVDTYKEYVISGIYVPSNTYYQSNSRIIKGYNADSATAYYNNYYLGDSESVEISNYQMAYEEAKSNYNSIGKDFETFDEFKEEFPNNKIYNGLYIEVKDEESLEDLTNTILKYDKYIEVNNNYTLKNANRYNFTFLKKSIVKQIFKICIILMLFIITLILMNKLYKYQNYKTIHLLRFYGFSIADFKRIKKNAYLKLGIYNIIIVIILNLILFNTHFRGLNKYFNLIYIFVFILIFIFYKRSLKRIDYANKIERGKYRK